MPQGAATDSRPLLSPQFEQPDGGQLVGDQDIEEPAVQRAQDRLGLVFPAGYAHDLGDAPKVGELDPYPPVVNRQVHDVAAGGGGLAGDVGRPASLTPPTGGVGG